MANMKFFLFLWILIFTSFESVNGDLCFGCRDTSSNDGKDDCQNDVSEMNKLHHIYVTEYNNNTIEFLKTYGENPLIQDCRSYPNFKYCMIEEMERLGSIQSYIRGCSNGQNFSVSLDNVHQLKFLQSNNQTLCGYFENKGVVVCVTLCEGPFCNGPASFADSLHIVSIGLLIFCHMIWRLIVT